MTQPQPNQYGPNNPGQIKRILTSIFNVLRESGESLAQLAPTLPPVGIDPDLAQCDPDYLRQAELIHTDVHANLIVGADLLLYYVSADEQQQRELSTALYHLSRADDERDCFEYPLSQVYLELAVARIRDIATYVAKIKNITPPAPPAP